MTEAIHRRDNEARTSGDLEREQNGSSPELGTKPWALMIGGVWEMGKRVTSRCH